MREGIVIFPLNIPVGPVGLGTSVEPVSAILSGMFAPVAPVLPVDEPVAPLDDSAGPVDAPVASVGTSLAPVGVPVAPVDVPVAPVDIPVAPVGGWFANSSLTVASNFDFATSYATFALFTTGATFPI